MCGFKEKTKMLQNIIFVHLIFAGLQYSKVFKIMVKIETLNTCCSDGVFGLGKNIFILEIYT
ncbi:hypothetical protein BpHYR1_047001 [Brachionus plicatilis]|uniref:Uncharacterized protein n=1 Tax=Brachionus plicatilis TaxID=10195 RepID=A0A3M7SDA8_BRAPC|nr:hypothetical protein BpHYR1_047001 [Brachionus plicatilis]